MTDSTDEAAVESPRQGRLLAASAGARAGISRCCGGGSALAPG